MATEVIHTIKPASSSPEGDYTTISAWESAQQRNLTTPSPEEIAVAECYIFSGGLNDTPVITGWTVSETAYICIRAAAGQEHNGIAQNGFYLGGTDSRVLVQTAFTRVEDLHFYATVDTSLGQAQLYFEADDCVAVRCLAVYAGGAYASFTTGFFVGGNPNGGKFYNCSSGGFATHSASAAFYHQGTSAVSEYYNCTAYSSSIGYRVDSADNGICRNCIALDNTTDFSSLVSQADSSHCASGDDTEPPPNAVFGDLVVGDFGNIAADIPIPAYGGRLKNTSGLINHLDLTTDIGGRARGELYAIGAYEQGHEAITTVRASGASPEGDYTTLSAWESAEQRDLETGHEVAVTECYDDWPSGLTNDVTVAGWTTNGACFPLIRAAAGQGHAGVVDAGFRLDGDILLRADNNVVEDINCIDGQLSVADGPSTTVEGVINRCIVQNKDKYRFRWVSFNWRECCEHEGHKQFGRHHRCQ